MKYSILRWTMLGTLIVSLALRAVAQADKPLDLSKLPPAARGKIDFVRDIQPLFANHCYKCHGPKKQKSGLALHRKKDALEGGDSGLVILPGKSAASPLIHNVAGLEKEHLMPPAGEGRRLSPREIGLLRAWIDQGAAWPADADNHIQTTHWAYLKPVRPPLPKIKNARWPRNGLDYFVLARLEGEGLNPSPEADRATLLRRLSLDLTGLPPTIAEVDAFLADRSANAYEKAVDRLLASPRYGERWARPWLDLARYADTNGYEKDRPRTMWLWRDWVIKALNDDMPFDRFSIEQLAGDLLPNAAPWQKVATGFHRNSMLNDEGGIDPEEFRVVAVKDRVDTTATVWLGTTIECAQCHSHKYDPFTQKEYYQLFAFLNQTADSGVGNGPEIPVPSPEEQKRIDEINARIKDLEKEVTGRGAQLEKAQAEWEIKVLAEPRSTGLLPRGLYLHYPLSSAKGKRVDDASGEKRHGIYQGAKPPAWVGGFLRFDGAGGFVDAGDAADFERTDSFSYGCWLKPETNGGCVLSRIDDPKAYRGFDLYLSQGRFEAHFSHSWPGNAMKVRTENAFAPGSWYHVKVTYAGTSKAAGVRIYVNGKEEKLVVEKDALNDTIRTEVSFKVGRRHLAGPFKGLVADVRVYDRRLSATQVGVLAARHPILAIVAIPPAKRTAQQRTDLAAYYRSIDSELVKLQDRIGLQEFLRETIRPTTSLVLQELTKPRPNYLMLRGDFKQKGAKVAPDVPAVLHPFPRGAPRNRLGLARWLVSPENPLVGRVAVNRAWAAFFGRGLVQTPEDFGTQGERPVNPELLDWLAVEFVNGATGGLSAWSMKALHRTIVTSATYRQSSRAPAKLMERDPYNHLLARGPRLRVEYEMLRDLALSAGGLQSSKIGGPSAMPPQPAGIWENSFGFYDLPDFRWKDAEGADRYRRGLYIFLRRSALYPTFTMFDAPSREICSVKRSRTNTPLQALTTLNDPVFVEAAGSLARRALKEAGPELKDRIVFAFRLCLARKPDAREIELLVGLYKKALSRFEKDPEAAAALNKSSRANPKGLNILELAAWTVVANVLLNLDETITKG